MRRFELVDGSSSKFWEISQNGSEFTVRFGRIGTDGQGPKTKDMGTSEKAAAEVEKLIRAKTGKGYAETANTAGTTSVSEKASRKKAVKKKATGKKAAASVLSAKLEKDFQACEALLPKGSTGRDEWVEKNCKRMKSWQEAAEASDDRGQVLYGLCFYYGSGVKENDKTAVEWFTKSAEQGNAQGQYYLGQCFFFGHGVKENDKTAVKWFTRSAEQGNAQGQFSLGECYGGGHGVKEDEEEYLKWVRLAADQGHEEAIEHLTDFEELEDDDLHRKPRHTAKRIFERMYRLVTSGQKLSHAEAEFVRAYLSQENGDGEDAYLEFEMNDGQNLTAEVATLLSEWRPDNAGPTVIYCDTRSLSDEAAKALSKLGYGEIQLTELSMLSDRGAKYLTNTKAGLRVNVEKLPTSVVNIFQDEMDVHDDFGDGEISFG